MESTPPDNAEQRDAELVQAGTRFGYGYWLQPIVNSNNMDHQSGAENVSLDIGESALPRRGRGRPRVSKPRDESAIEKRRAQVREAQRTYQKRKETAAASEKRRCDDLLQVLSDLSTDIEALLQAASNAGCLDQDDEVSRHIQKLWSSYDAAINAPCVKPELPLLQVKNDRRVAEQRNYDNFRVELAPRPAQEPSHETRYSGAVSDNDPLPTELELVRVNEGTLIQSFQRFPTADKVMAGRTMLDVVKERQAALRSSQRF